MTDNDTIFECLYEAKKIKRGVKLLASSKHNPLDELVYITYEMKGTLGVEGLTEVRDLAALLEDFFKSLQDENDIPPLSDVVLQDALTVVTALAHRLDDSHEYTDPDNAAQTLQICIDESVTEAESLRLPDDAPMPSAQEPAVTDPLKMTAPDTDTTPEDSTTSEHTPVSEATAFTPAGDPEPVSPDVTRRVSEIFGDQTPQSRIRIQSLEQEPFNHTTNPAPDDTPDTTRKTVQIVVVNGIKYGIPVTAVAEIPDTKTNVQADPDTVSPTTEDAISLHDVLDTPSGTDTTANGDEMLFVHDGATGTRVLRVDAVGDEMTLDCTPLTGVVSGIHGVQGVGSTDTGETVHVLDVGAITG